MLHVSSRLVLSLITLPICLALSGCLDADLAWQPLTPTAVSSSAPSGSSTHLSFAVAPTGTAVAGTGFTTAPQVALLDASNQVVATDNSLVSIAAFTDAACVSGALGILSGNSQTNVAGVSNFSTLSYTKAESIYLKASSGLLSTACLGPVVVSAAAAAQITVLTQPSASAAAGVAFATQPAFQIKDSYGNLVPGAVNVITLTAYQNSNCTLAAGALFGTNPVSATAGVANFSGINSHASGPIYLGAASGSLSPICTNAVAVSPGMPALLSFGTLPSGLLADTNFSIQVSEKDTYGNSIPGATDTITLAAFAGAGCGAAATGTFSGGSLAAAGGSASFGSLFYRKAESISIKASAAGITSACSGVLVIGPGSLNNISFTTNPPTSASAGAAFTVTPQVSVFDAYSNLITGSAGTVSVNAASDAACTSFAGAIGNGSASVSSGVAAFATAYYGTAQTIYLKATYAGKTACSANSIVVTAGSPAKLTTSDYTYFYQNGCAGPFQVTSQDTFSNNAPVAGATTVNLSGSMNATYYSNATCTTPITSVTIAAAASTSSQYYVKDTAAETYTLTAQATSFTSLLQAMYSRTQIAMTAGPTSIVAGTCAGPYTMSNLDASASPVVRSVSANSTFNLTDSSNSAGTFYSDAACSTPITTLTIANAASSANFYYVQNNVQSGFYLQSTSPYTNPLTAYQSNATYMSISVSAGTPANLILTGPSLTTTGVCSAAFAVSSTDTFRNLANVGAAKTVNLSTAGSGIFYSDAGCTAVVTSVSISAGLNLAKFYLKNSVAETVSVTSAAAGLTSSSFLVSNLVSPAASQASLRTSHGCAIASGKIKCWGSNNYGQLGNHIIGGSYSTAVPVVDNASTPVNGATAIVTGYSHTCAIIAGGAYCWGYNGYGNLGNGSYSGSSYPVPVSGLSSGVIALSSGDYSTCALLSNGSVQCWGYNYYGQVGNGTTSTQPSPVPVTSLSSGVTALSVGSYHACAIQSGAALCWGNNYYGQLGNNSTTNSSVPVSVQGLNSGITSITTGSNHSCAATAANTSCWGYNGYGNLGNNSYTSSEIPVAVALSGITSLTSGSYFTCAIGAANAVNCWGDNSYGQFGNNSTVGTSTPQAMSYTASGVFGGYDSLCIQSNNNITCAGNNAFGKLGNLRNDSILTYPLPLQSLN